MCGIFGVVLSKPDVGHWVYKALHSLSHRGPDGYGMLLANTRGQSECLYNTEHLIEEGAWEIAMGHRRLSIIDLSDNALQPMCNEDGRLWVAFNGEIYNFEQLRSELESKGHSFKTERSDTEVIVHGYEQWGQECLEHFRGMFAFALLDLKKRIVFAARDRVGKKPFYYFFDGHDFVFASELKSLSYVPFFNRQVNPEALADYLCLGYIPAPKSIWRNVHKILPGEGLVYDIDGRRITKFRYWEPSFISDPAKDETYWMDGIACLLHDAVQIRTVADVPVGAFLSGGVDSSAVAAFLSSARRPVRAFTVRFREQECDESIYASIVARHIGLPHKEITVTSAEAAGVMDKIFWHYDEPFNDYSYFPTYCICRCTAQKVKVALSGDGGDELFCGYPYYGTANRQNGALRRAWRTVFARMANPIFHPSLKGKDCMIRWRRGVDFSLATSPWMGFVDVSAMRSVLKPEWRAAVGDYDPVQPFMDEIDRLKGTTTDALGLARALDFRFGLPERMLAKVDRASMACSLEVRNPFLDHKLIEFVSRIPSRFLVDDHGEGKAILKKLVSTLVPAECVYRKKQGFGIPVGRWFTEPQLGGFAERFLAGQKKTLFVRREYLQKLYDRHRSPNRLMGKFVRNRSNILLSLVFLENWGNTWL